MQDLQHSEVFPEAVGPNMQIRSISLLSKALTISSILIISGSGNSAIGGIPGRSPSNIDLLIFLIITKLRFFMVSLLSFNIDMAQKDNKRVQINNRRASFDYEFLETFQAGIVLVGTEIKSIRSGKASLVDAYCYFDTKGQLYVKGMNIAQYFWGSWGQHEPMRDRKLLLTKRELLKLRQAVKQKGLTIVATKMYIADNSYAKVQIALARGKKEYDKRQTIKEKDIRRELERG